VILSPVKVAISLFLAFRAQAALIRTSKPRPFGFDPKSQHPLPVVIGTSDLTHISTLSLGYGKVEVRESYIEDILRL
jgi:hypothetical protein